MEQRPSYSEVYAIVSFHAGHVLPLFADGWERFPVGKNAKRVVAELRDNARFWSGRNNEAASLITIAADEIEYRADNQ